MAEFIWQLDNIVIYVVDTKTYHQVQVENIQQQCVKHRLVVNLFKSKFYVYKSIFLVHVIDGQEIKIDTFKLDILCKWHIPTEKKEVQAFSSFANHYHRFIVNYSSKACTLIDLTKDVPFTQGHIQQQAFNKLQAQFLSTPILTQFDRTFKPIIDTNARNPAIPGIMFQYYVINRSKQLY